MQGQPGGRALFVSDVHLQPSNGRTCAAFFDFLERQATGADALYLLGDLFEYWAGDDDIDDPFLAQVITALRHVADAGVTLYWIAGNRDFLVGERFAAAANLTLLAEPHVSKIGGTTIALVHGDAQCTGDSGYMAFRTQVRQRAWQDQFLALPLAQRKAIIAGLREGSRRAQNDKSNDIMDVAQDAIEALLTESGSAILIHGHTHRPAVHTHGAATRYVLPDWDCDGATERGGWIAIDATGTVTRHDVRGATLS